MSTQQHLIVVRGLEDSRSHLARLLADALPGPTVHIPGDDIGRRWIIHPLAEQRQEVETVYRLLRLVTISFLKDGYSVVLDAPFIAMVDGIYELRTQEIHDLRRLAHSFRGIDTGVVTLEPSPSLPSRLAEALHADTIEGEIRVREAGSVNDADAVGDILARLGVR
ncbi:MAG: hypothetical protein AB7R89_26805 [Dehalococcoidia bacterium]